jgi:hypothetical protein
MGDKFPATDLDRLDNLVAVAGSWWADSYQGGQLAASVLFARAQLERQNEVDFGELLASVSRHRLPALHVEEWYCLKILESERNTEVNLPRFDGRYTFDGSIFFDTPEELPYHTWPVPDGLTSCPIVTDGVHACTLAWADGVDFVVRDGGVWFYRNPFDVDGVTKHEVFEAGEVVDREVRLWLYGSRWDRSNVHTQFGYVIDAKEPSSENYKRLVNAVFDALVEGTSAGRVEEAVSAIADVPLAAGGETVESVVSDLRHLWVVTDKNAYAFHPDSTAVVAAGDALHAGQAMTDGLAVYEFNRGQVPDDLRALSVGRGFLAAGYFSDLVFENKTVSLVVEPDVAGYTKVSFEVGGFPTDVEKFWADVHAAGVARGETLAMLMDRRPESARAEQPNFVALPPTVNPLGFLLQNVFRNNAFVVRLKAGLRGENALSLSNARLLRRLLPPHTACVIVGQVDVDDEAIDLAAEGDETEAGHGDDVTTFAGLLQQDDIPDDYVEDEVRCYQIGGRCI